jgi:hypothetical protein
VAVWIWQVLSLRIIDEDSESSLPTQIRSLGIQIGYRLAAAANGGSDGRRPGSACVFDFCKIR